MQNVIPELKKLAWEEVNMLGRGSVVLSDVRKCPLRTRERSIWLTVSETKSKPFFYFALVPQSLMDSFQI